MVHHHPQTSKASRQTQKLIKFGGNLRSLEQLKRRKLSVGVMMMQQQQSVFNDSYLGSVKNSPQSHKGALNGLQFNRASNKLNYRKRNITVLTTTDESSHNNNYEFLYSKYGQMSE